MPRKKPFSSKQKKLQLQQKRLKKKLQPDDDRDEKPVVSSSLEPKEESSSSSEEEEECASSELVSFSSAQYNPNRFKLHFDKDTSEEIEKRKKVAKTTPLVTVKETELEVGIEDIFPPGLKLDMPKRPVWSYSMTKAEVEKQEEEMFSDYVSRLRSTCTEENLSYFELNLETWRQLWRVLELSDVILLIADIRHPVLHFSPFLYRHVVSELKKQLVLVLNKVDLVPPSVAIAWKYYFLSHFPDLHVVLFTCYPTNYGCFQPGAKVKTKLRKRGERCHAFGPKELLGIIEKLPCGKVDTADLYKQVTHGNSVDTPELQTKLGAAPNSGTVFTIGLVGHPNVGKSSILNGIMGKKYVSTSRTPGHTKHLQTIFLTPQVRLCDCPGLVFPSLIDKRLQVLSGIYPIAQVREPYTIIGYLAERVPLVDLLQLTHPQQEISDDTPTTDGAQATTAMPPWTAWDICDGWAFKKQYYTSKAARLDTYRAANQLLRLANDGRITLFFMPPKYCSTKDEWERHEDIIYLLSMQQARVTIPIDSQHTIASSEDDSTASSDSSQTEEKMEDMQPMTHSNKFAALLDIEDDS